MSDRLSPFQKRAIEKRRRPYRHAMDRLKERHFPDISDDFAETCIEMMTKLCAFRAEFNGGRTTKLVNVEAADSWIIDVDMFEDRHIIRVCYDPINKRIRTVLPKA